MHFQFTPYILPLIAASIFSSWAIIYTWRRRSHTGATSLSLLAMAVTEWLLGYALEIAGADLPTKLFFGKIQYIGIILVPLVWLIFAYNRANQARVMSHRWMALLSIIPLITLILSFTADTNGLLWTHYSIYQSGSFSVLKITHGVWFWVINLYTDLLVSIGTIIILRSIIQDKGIYRWQATAMFAAALAPWAGNILYVTGFGPIPNLDLTPFGFAISAVTMTLGIFGFRLIDLPPIARHSIVEEMQDAVIVLDLNHVVKDLNRSAQRLAGCTSRQAIGRTADEVFTRVQPLLEALHANQGPIIEAVIGEGANPAWFSISISPLHDQRRRPIGRLVVLHDITERKRTEKELALAHEQALEASRMKSQLLAKVSHELRTPLGVILGYGELLHNERFGPLDESQKEATAIVIESSHYLDFMVSELLDEAQIEAKTLTLHPRRFSPADMLVRVTASIALLCSNKGLTFETCLAPELPEEMYADDQRLQEILLNLAGNAVKFTQKGGVTIRLFLCDQEHWAMQVEDTGAGIPPEAHSYIFEPFRQVDNAITHQNRGTGLGLSITKHLTELMGGSIQLESEVGRGSKFTVVLPIVRN